MKRNLKDKLTIPFIRLSIHRYSDDKLLNCYKSCIESTKEGLYLKLPHKDRHLFIIYRTLIFNEVTNRKLLKDK